MKTAVDIYEAFLIEIDRFGSPDCQVVDFIHHWNNAVYLFMEEEMKVYELTNIVSDRLRMVSHILKVDFNSESCSDPKKEWAIPNDYYRMFGLKGVFRFARDLGFQYKKGDELEKPIKKLTSDIEGFVLENRFYRPSLKRPAYMIRDNKILFKYEDDFVTSSPVFLKQFELSYIKHPTPLDMDDSFTSFNESPFPIDVNRLILKLAVLSFMGSTEDSRIQLKAQL